MRVRPAIILSAFLLASCDQPFEPKGAYDPRLAVYALLTTASDTQFVRLHATYDPPAFDPFEQSTEPDLSAAVATLQSGPTSVVMRDTLLPRPDSARYGPTMHAFYAAPLTVQRGSSYTLTVTAPGWPQASAVTRVPGIPEFFVSNSTVLTDPGGSGATFISIVVRAPVEAKGYVARLFIEYDILTPPGGSDRVEVPASLVTVDNVASPVYPRLQPAVLQPEAPSDRSSIARFTVSAYTYAFDVVRARYGETGVKFRRVKLYLTLVDEHLYNYYNIVNSFVDPYSIRTDVPDYSNVRGGVGIVGAMTLDSLTYTLP